MARLHTETIPTSTLAATARVVDGFVTTQTDHQGITSSFTRAYTVTGVTLTATDGRGNTTTTHTDLAGRSISSTDAAGNTTATVYDADFDQPSVITNAQGKTACYKYDLRGRKVAEWGTAIQSPRRLVGGLDKCAAFAPKGRGRNGVRPSQSDRGLGESLDKRAAFAPKGRGRNGVRPSQPALFSYDDADNMTALTTFRADSGDITTDPTGRTDGDTTTWAYHPAAGVELSKTYADNSQVVKTYDALIRRRLTAPHPCGANTPCLSNRPYRLLAQAPQAGPSGAFNRLATETNARGIVKTLSYDAATGQLTGISFSDDETPSQSFAYNILGQLTQVTDAAGTRSIAYNEYSEQQSDSLDSGAHTHLVTELRDSYGRSTGFTYARSGATQFTTSVSYGEDGRIATAGFMHGGVNRQFSYSYLSGSNLLHTLTQPNGLTLTQSYEEHRDLLTDMQYHRGSTLVVERSYSEDKAPDGRKGDWTNAQHLPEGRGAVGRLRVTLGRPTNRSTARQGSVKNDTFTHNDRSESARQSPRGPGGGLAKCAAFAPEGRAANGVAARQPRLGHLRQLVVRAISQMRSICPAGARSREAAPSQVFSSGGTILTAYTYTPYGAVTANGNVTQPIQWSSEYNDSELGLVYYNYRHYNPSSGKWGVRDNAAEFADRNLYNFLRSNSLIYIEYLGYVPHLNMPSEEIRDFIMEQNEGNPVANGVDLSKCIYFVFYDREDKTKVCDHRWHKFKDNNYLSHVAVYMQSLPYPIGFNPSHDDCPEEIVYEKRTDIAHIVRCCKQKSNYSEALGYLRISKDPRYSSYYFQRLEDGSYLPGKKWDINKNNCATFAWNTCAIYFDDYTEPRWDDAFLYIGVARRPEEFRRFLRTKSECTSIYVNKTWEGTLDNEA